MQIVPIAITQPNWPAYIAKATELLGISPTKGLDNHDIALSSPQAYLASLDLSNDPITHLREGSVAFDHYHISFMLDCDTDTLVQFSSLRVRVYTKKARQGWLVILTANMTEWREAIVENTREKSPPVLIQVFSFVYTYLCNHGFRDVFIGYTSKRNIDGITVWKK